MRTRFLFRTTLSVTIIATLSLPSLAQPIKTFTFQGELHDAVGDPVADGPYDILFRLYTTSVGATEIWQQSLTVSVLAGRFSAILGKGIALPDIDRPLWLGISVGRDPEMTPRTEISGVPYSLGLATPMVVVGSGGTHALSVEKSTSTGGSAIRGATDGVGYGIYGNAIGSGVAVAGFSQGVGQAGWFEVQNPASDEEAIFARTNGVAAVIGAQHEGTSGIAGWFGVVNPANTSDALYGQTPGSGAAVSGKASGFGIGVKGANTGTGMAGLFQITNNSSSAAALSATTSGLGVAASLSNNNVSNSNHVLDLNSYGTGALLSGAKSLVPQFVFENDGTLKLYNAGVPVITLDKDFNGDGRIFTEEIEITGGSDLAELFDVAWPMGHQTVEPGMLVSIDPEHPGRLVVSSQTYDQLVVGVVSGAGDIETGMTMGQKGSVADGAYPIAIAGRVYVLAEAVSAPIRAGDLLTSSDIPGYAMRVMERDLAFGATVGKALSSLPSGKGLVLLLVSLH